MATYESYKVGDHEFSNPSFPIQVLKVDYAYDDLDLSIPVDAGVMILAVANVVSTAFAGGTPAVSCGITGSTELFLTATELACGTPGMVNSFGLSTGKWTGASTSAVVLTGSTELTAGEGSVYLFLIDPRENWRTDGQF